MFTITIKAILSLFPFLKEIVENLQKGPRDRRTKNPLTPWFVICLVFMIAGGTIAGRYMVDLMDEVRELTLAKTNLEHQLSLKAGVVTENIELKRQLVLAGDRLDEANSRTVAVQATLETSIAETKRVTEAAQKLARRISDANDRIVELERLNTEVNSQLSRALERKPARVVVSPGRNHTLLSEHLRS